MSDPAHTFQIIAAVVADIFKVPATSVTHKTTADDVRGWDSLAHSRVIMAIERAAGIRLPTKRAFAAVDVDALCRLVTEVRENHEPADAHRIR